MALFQDIAKRAEVHFSMMFQPGDLQFLKNCVTVHARTAFENYDKPDRKRRLLRPWFSVRNSRPLSPALAPFRRDTRAGAVRRG